VKSKVTTNRKERKGFTLVELLISIAIFVIFMGVVSSSYISIVRAQREANDVRKMYSEVRGFTDRFSEDVRLGSVIYDCYGAPNVDAFPNTCPTGITADRLDVNYGKTNRLLIQKQDGLERSVYLYDKDKKVLEEKRYIRQNGLWNESAGYETAALNVFSDLIEVEDLEFIVSPDVDPYANVYKNEKQFQPQVTLVMTLSNGKNVNSPFKFNFQTTITSRVYSRQ
jgi:prepilin-type N-terminal cleavage/methylation domain-containing protein